MSKVTMPERPDPDGFLAIRLAGHEVEVNAYRDSTLDAYAEAYAAAKVREPQEWRPIETAPDCGEWALVFSDGAINCMFVQKGRLPEYWTKPQTPNIDPSTVTHWKPLPPPPAE